MKTNLNTSPKENWSSKSVNHIEKVMRKMEKDFIIDEHNESVVVALYTYFTQSPKFEEFGFGSLQKGLYLGGNVGTGKTYLLKLFLKGFPRYKVFKPREIAHAYATHCVDFNTYLPNRFLGEAITPVLLDDIGTETIPAVYMGNRENVVEAIIEKAYDRGKDVYKSLYLTGNLSGERIEELYGSRSRSRFREMFNSIFVPGPDRRK